MNTSSSKIIRRLTLPLALITMLAACGSGEDVVESVPTTVPPPVVATPEPTPTPTPTPESTPYPLTGVPAEDESRFALTTLGVKVDNSSTARPQMGLSSADIVIEELVEGGITRFMAIFHSTDPGVIGPVRSGRDIDADLFPPFAGILTISGAAGPTYSVLHSAGLMVIEEGGANGAVHRVSGRPAPHNLVAEADQIWAFAEERPAASQPWSFQEEPPAGGTPVEALAGRFSESYAHTWVWSDADGAFLRGQNGTPHLTAEGPQIAVKNVVYVSVNMVSAGGVDVNGSSTMTADLSGSGQATFFRDGQMFTGTWRKDGRSQHFQWLDADGAPFPMAPGQTFIELQPSRYSVDTTIDPAPLLSGVATAEPTGSETDNE